MKRLCMLIVLLAVGLAAFAATDASGNAKASRAGIAKPDLRAILYAPDAKWRSGTPLRLVFYIVNRSKSPVTIDRRMGWPGTLDMLVRLPDGKVTRVQTLAVKIPLALEEQMLTLYPGQLHGTVLTVSPEREYLVPQMRSPAPGRYELWVTYYSPGDMSRHHHALSLRSNRVVVTVKR